MRIVHLAFLIAFVPTFATAEPGQEIPLNEIWAYRMPGTKDVRELEPEVEIARLEERAKKSDVMKIVKVLSKGPKENQTAGPAFVVTGIGTEALKNAAVALSKEPASWPKSAPANTDLSLVFFSHYCGYEVQLTKVEKLQNQIDVEFRFADHDEQSESLKFALIPLGKLSAGKVEVRLGDNLKSKTGKGPKSGLLQLVSQSSSFEVRPR